jgi:hypothetical protein
VIIVCIIFIALCFANPTEFVFAGTNGLNLIYNAVLPILFPFFFLSSFIVNLFPNNSRHSVTFVVLLSYFSGYPNGARLIGQLYSRGEISKERVRTLSVYTATASPIFVVVSVGTVMLGNTAMGIFIFISMILGAVLNGFLWHQKSAKEQENIIYINNKTELSILKNFNSAVYSSVTAILNVCGIILMFYIFVSIINIPPLLSGIMEMTTGTARISTVRRAPQFIAAIICFIVSFGGISVAMQNFIFMKDYDLPPMFYFAYKTTHAIISTAILSAILLL